jgi:hypothetical protein
MFVKKYSNFEPKKQGVLTTKESSVEKTPFFDVFRKPLSYKQLHGFTTVNGRFTKNEFAKGIVLVRER